MNKILTHLSLIGLFFMINSMGLLAQENAASHQCLFDHAIHTKSAVDPLYKSAVNSAFEKAKAYTKTADFQRDINETLRIPVVVHIVYKEDEQDLSDDLVFSQIDALNENFNRTTADTANTREIFKPLATSANIEFYLAEVDPFGDPTDGITRTQTNTDSFFSILDLLGSGIDDVKSDDTGGKDPWPTDQYLNIWVCNLAIDLFGQESPGVLGFAYPPKDVETYEEANWPAGTVPDNSEDVDGIVIYHAVFGKDNPVGASIDLGNGQTLGDTNGEGRTAVHEAGHYLGLRHIWGDGGNALLGTPGTCEEDDGLTDTPSATESSQQTCNYATDTCEDEEDLPPIGPDNYPDMIENYMDYSTEQCQNMFTQQQVELMRSVLILFRADLLEDTPAPTTNNNLPTWEYDIYPNPTKDFINIQSAQENLMITLFDLKGQELKQLKSNQGNTKIDLSNLAAGVYTLQLSDGVQTVSEKIIIQ